jgi:hypothetical protein
VKYPKITHSISRRVSFLNSVPKRVLGFIVRSEHASTALIDNRESLPSVVLLLRLNVNLQRVDHEYRWISKFSASEGWTISRTKPSYDSEGKEIFCLRECLASN